MLLPISESTSTCWAGSAGFEALSGCAFDGCIVSECGFWKAVFKGNEFSYRVALNSQSHTKNIVFDCGFEII